LVSTLTHIPLYNLMLARRRSLPRFVGVQVVQLQAEQQNCQTIFIDQDFLALTHWSNLAVVVALILRISFQLPQYLRIGLHILHFWWFAASSAANWWRVRTAKNSEEVCPNVTVVISNVCTGSVGWKRYWSRWYAWCSVVTSICLILWWKLWNVIGIALKSPANLADVWVQNIDNHSKTFYWK